MGVVHSYAKIVSHHRIKIDKFRELVKLKGSKPEGRRFKYCPRDQHLKKAEKNTYTAILPGGGFLCLAYKSSLGASHELMTGR